MRAISEKAMRELARIEGESPMFSDVELVE